MVIACPACGRRFGVNDDLLPPEGRRARCAGCGEEFHAARPGSQASASVPHYKTIVMPGDGLASESAFAAPAAPAGRTPPAPLGGDQRTEDPSWTPSLLSLPPVDDDPGLEHAAGHSTVAVDPTQMSALRKVLEPVPSRGETAPASPAAAAASSQWKVRDGRGSDAALLKKDLAREIREGTLEEDDPVLPPGIMDWQRAGDVPELAYYFRLRDAAAANTGSEGAGENQGAGVATVVQLVPESFALVLRGINPLLAGTYALLRVFAGFAPIAGLPVRLALATFDLLVIIRASGTDRFEEPAVPPARGASGSPGTDASAPEAEPAAAGVRAVLAGIPLPAGWKEALPISPRLPEWREVLILGGAASTALFLALVPLLAFNSILTGALVTTPPAARDLAAAGTVVLAANLLLWGFYAVYAPMALGLAALRRSALPAANPALVFGAISRIPDEYTATVLLFVLISALAAFVESLCVPWGLAGTVLASIFWTALHFGRLALLGRVLGRTLARLHS